MLLQKTESFGDEVFVVRQRLAQAELGTHQPLEMRVESIAIVVIDGAPQEVTLGGRPNCRLIASQRAESLGQTIEIPLPDMRLVAIAVAALIVGVVADVAGVEGLHEAEGSVVERQTEDGHVVGIHHAVHEADRHPARDQFAGAAADIGEQGGVGIGGRATLGAEVVDHVIGQ